jgi:hypothetical protein
LTSPALGAFEPGLEHDVGASPVSAGLLPWSTPIRLVCFRGSVDDVSVVVCEEVVMETLVERAAGLDVHKAMVTASVRVPGRRG